MVSRQGILNACLVVSQKSTTSCVCTPLEGCSIKKDDSDLQGLSFQEVTQSLEETAAIPDT